MIQWITDHWPLFTGPPLVALAKWLANRNGLHDSWLRRLSRFLTSVHRLTLKEAADEATAQEMQGLRADIALLLADNDRLRAVDARHLEEILRLQAKTDSSAGAGTRSTSSAGEKTPPPKPPARPSEK